LFQDCEACGRTRGSDRYSPSTRSMISRRHLKTSQSSLQWRATTLPGCGRTFVVSYRLLERGNRDQGQPVYRCSIFRWIASGDRATSTDASPKKHKVFPAIHQGEAVDVPVGPLRNLSNTTAHALALSAKKGAFAHFKLYGVRQREMPVGFSR